MKTKKKPTDKRGYFAAEARETLTNMTVKLRIHYFWQGNEAAILSVLFKFQTKALEMKLRIYTDACEKFFGDHEIVIQVTKFYPQHQ